MSRSRPHPEQRRFPRPRTLTAAALLVLAPLAGCKDTRKLDEAVFYEGPVFTLKVVRFYRNLLFSYNGETFSVQCASVDTADYAGNKFAEPGWYQLGSGGAIGTESADDVIEQIKDDYIIVDANTLAIPGTTFRVSFSGCTQFKRWDPTTLPPEMIDPVEKPAHCAPQGTTGDCRYYDYHDDRAPLYEDIQIDPEGRVSFIVRTKTFKDVAGLRVSSSDAGETWTVTPVTPIEP
jgi:hypothetical protein